jgi:CRISPR-associated protein Csc2
MTTTNLTKEKDENAKLDFFKILENLSKTKNYDYNKFFHNELQEVPSGKYAHIILLRKTDSFSIFQTDGEINTAKVSMGVDNNIVSDRVVLFKRKGSTPERLTGREMLRENKIIRQFSESERTKKTELNDYKKIDENITYVCEYNSKFTCKTCPDCILYGFAVGDKGSKKSFVYTDSCFSITESISSIQNFTLNQLNEWGTMHEYKQNNNISQKTGLAEPEHVLPQIYFPSIITIKDPTEACFAYVLISSLMTRRYGANTTRTGTMDNKLMGIFFSNNEIFSNLLLTQTTYDNLNSKDLTKLTDKDAVDAISQAIKSLIESERCVKFGKFFKEDFAQKVLESSLSKELNNLSSDEANYKQLIMNADKDTKKYSKKYGCAIQPPTKPITTDKNTKKIQGT